MPRPVWTGTIAFGLVSIPVGLYTAIQEHRPRFNQLQRGTSDRIRYRRVNEATGEEVPYEEIVRGFPISRGRYVILEDEDLAAAAPRASKTIDLLDFVESAEIDPVYYDTPYYLVPQGNAARRPYSLFAAALQEAGRVGIASFVLREREHLCAIRSRGSELVLETMHFADEVRALPEELAGLDELEPRGRELEIAVSLIESMASSFEPERYRDEYRDRLEEIVKAKDRGEEVVVEEQPAEQPAQVIDLVSVLSRSVAEARKRRGEATAASHSDEPPDSPRSSTRRASAPARGDGASPSGAKRRKQGSEAAGPGTRRDQQLEELARAELYERARELDIPNRSGMTRQELIDAISAATAPAGRGRRRAS